ncbi:hypothetical protein EON79_10035, partial [bacterium]
MKPWTAVTVVSFLVLAGLLGYYGHRYFTPSSPPAKVRVTPLEPALEPAPKPKPQPTPEPEPEPQPEPEP